MRGPRSYSAQTAGRPARRAGSASGGGARGRRRGHPRPRPPQDAWPSVVRCPTGREALSESVERLRELSPSAAPILVFGGYLDLPLAPDALPARAPRAL